MSAQEEEIIGLLNTVSYLSCLDEAELREIARNTYRENYPQNTLITIEGDQPDWLYIIVTGKVKVYLSTPAGKEIVLTTLQDGDYFGEISLLDGMPRSATIAAEENTTCLKIHRNILTQRLLENPQMAVAVIKQLTERVRILSENVKNLGLLNIQDRVLIYLCSISEIIDDKRVIKDRLTHQEIADRVGASREMVTRTLAKLQKLEYLEIEQGVIRILKEVED